MPADEREACERQANSAKEKYYAVLAEYKKTIQYETYQKYLEDFKAKHAAPTKGLFLLIIPTSGNKLVTIPEGKRSKLETETSTSTQSSSHDQHERAAIRRLSTAITDFAGQHGPGTTPPLPPTGLPSGPPYPSKPTSPVSHPLSGFNSPRTVDLYSPVSASPRSNALYKDAVFDASFSHPAQALGSQNSPLPYHSTVYMHPHPPYSNMTTPTNSYASHYQPPSDHPSRRPRPEPSLHLPGLTHEDTTLSSESGHSNHSPPQATQPSQMNPSNSLRLLPQPVPSIGLAQPPLDRTLPQPSLGPPALIQLPPPDYRTQGSLATLVKAGEIAAREVDNQSIKRDD